METKEWRFTDKSTWEDGPWMSEPDAMQWSDTETGLPCLIRRGPQGALCGYVGVSPGHPAYQMSYSNIDYSAHGGLTYSDFCEGEPGTGICHLPEPGEPDRVWWLGFDCAHYRDFKPGRPDWNYIGDRYRDVAYVRSECAMLARQLWDAAIGGAETER